jgi:hypothetical protein
MAAKEKRASLAMRVSFSNKSFALGGEKDL